MDETVVYGAVVMIVTVLLVYLLCTRRRKPVVIRATDRKTDFVEEPIRTTTASSQYSAKGQANKQAMKTRHNSLFKVFKDEDVHAIASSLRTLEEVSEAIRKAGLERCNLIFGVDYTASNYLQGKKTFGKKCLHHIGPDEQNPYQRVIATLGETLKSFDLEGVIPAFGFGDAITRDVSIFQLKPDGVCRNFEEVLQVYNKITPKVQCSGPTNFAPLIKQAAEIAKHTGKYHLLVIVADGQVNSEQATIDAIVDASNYPLSIVMVGVGDGPWMTMNEFDNRLPARKFDNFHFVDFHAVTNEASNPHAAFALHALLEIPDQYKAIKNLGLLKA